MVVEVEKEKEEKEGVVLLLCCPARCWPAAGHMLAAGVDIRIVGVGVAVDFGFLEAKSKACSSRVFSTPYCSSWLSTSIMVLCREAVEPVKAVVSVADNNLMLGRSTVLQEVCQ